VGVEDHVVTVDEHPADINVAVRIAARSLDEPTQPIDAVERVGAMLDVDITEIHGGGGEGSSHYETQCPI
jgi:hypothetical protein